jgi:DNA end-binding protein Ku
MPKQVAPALVLAQLPKVAAKRSPGHNLELQIGLLTFPIKLHTGARADRISFRQLHSKCLGRLKQQAMHCPHCDESVDSEEIVKGYEYAKDQYAVVTKEELDAQKPETCKIVEVSTFVDAGNVDPIYFETSHYIAPGDGGARPFALIRDVLIKSGKVGIGRATFANSEHIILIRPYNNGLALHTLFYQEELKSFPVAVDQITSSAQEMKLAAQLVQNMTGTFNPSEFADSYAANVKELVATKLNGTAPKLVERKPRKIENDFLSALTASVHAAKTKKAA